jgi:hypothetical protein
VGRPGCPQRPAPRDHGGRSVIDPFGNILGVMYNQHYLDVLASLVGE